MKNFIGEIITNVGTLSKLKILIIVLRVDGRQVHGAPRVLPAHVARRQGRQVGVGGRGDGRLAHLRHGGPGRPGGLLVQEGADH